MWIAQAFARHRSEGVRLSLGKADTGRLSGIYKLLALDKVLVDNSGKNSRISYWEANQMSAEQNRQKDLVDTTDCLEAVGVFRCWKNLFFVVILVGLLLLGVCFWVMDLGLVSAGQKSEQAGTAETATEQVVPGAAGEEQMVPVVEQAVDEVKQQVSEAAAQVTGDVNAPAAETGAKAKKPLKLPFTLRQAHVMRTIAALDAVLIMAAVLYCLTILFTLKISMVGRLGGISHISRAFFWSLILLAFIVPWQVVLGWGLFGVTFKPSELVQRMADYELDAVFLRAFFWFRFVVLWAIALLCLILAQIRTARWSKATLKRLEVI
jgi:hypothetical protein